MSVINKMLKDLDERQEGASSQGQSSQDTLHQSMSEKGVTHQMTATGRTISPILLGILVVIAGLLGFIGWQMMQSNSFQSRGAMTPSEGLDSASSNAAPSTLMSADSSSESTASTKNKDANPEGIPVPEEDPDPAAELPAEAAPEDELTTQAEPLEDVVPEPNENTDDIAAELEGKNLEALAEENDPVARTNQSESQSSPTQLKTDGAGQRPPTAEAKPAEANSPAPTFVIEKTSNKLTPEERVARLLDKAKTAYEKGYITEAIEDLTKLLSISDSNIEARTLLAGAWYGRGEGNRAIAIINDGLQRYPLVEEWRTTAAKIFFKENNLAGAFSYLNVELTDAGKEFYTLKGNLARQLKEFGAAESAYKRLTEIEPFVGNWWLGLAIAQDSQDKTAQALESYQRVIAIGGVSAQSVAFAQQRIEVLKG